MAAADRRAGATPESSAIAGQQNEATKTSNDSTSWRNLYVVNQAGGLFGTVTVYAPGKKTPSRTIGRGIEAPLALAFDRSGNLYIGNAGTVTVYRRGTRSLLRTLKLGEATGRLEVFGLAFDREGYLYVAVYAGSEGEGHPGFVAIYPPNSSHRFAIIERSYRRPV